VEAEAHALVVLTEGELAETRFCRTRIVRFATERSDGD
jgi:hypothetical protein